MEPGRTWFTNENCSVARTLEVIGERWTLLVLREASLGVLRFEDHPPRFEYRVTPRGLDLYPILVSLVRWGDKYVAAPGGPPIVLEHKACGHDILPQLVCSQCGDEIAARDVIAKP